MIQERKQKMLDRFKRLRNLAPGFKLDSYRERMARDTENIEGVLEKVNEESVMSFIESFRYIGQLRRDINDLLLNSPDDSQLARIIELQKITTTTIFKEKQTLDGVYELQCVRGPTTGSRYQEVDIYGPKYTYEQRKSAIDELKRLKTHPDKNISKLVSRLFKEEYFRVSREITHDNWEHWKKENPGKTLIGNIALWGTLITASLGAAAYSIYQYYNQ